MPRLTASRTSAVVVALGTAQTLSWASTYYLPAVLATPIAADLGISPTVVFAAFSAALVVSALVGPAGGRRIDRRGGRPVLVVSNLVFAAGLAALGLADGVPTLVAAFVLLGFGMGIGLYESAFATLAGIYGTAARRPITGITLIAGFASTVGWPISALLEAEYGWRVACFVWALVQILIALPLNLILPSGTQIAASASPPEGATATPAPAPPPPHRLTPAGEQRAMVVLALVFAVSLFTATTMAAHLPRLLEAAGATPATAIAAGALIGPAQVVARIAEFGLMQRFHPLWAARLAIIAHPLAAGLLLALGAPAAFAFALLHGAGNGVMTIVKGTLPLALFGAVGYGARLGLINAPGRVAQALAPLAFGLAIEGYGASAILITATLGLLAFAALFLLSDRGRPEV